MTAEDAIHVLEDGEWWRWCNVPVDTPEHTAFHDALDLAISALRVQQEAEKNEPLTIEELRDMEGMPVWVQSPGIPRYARWAIVLGVNDDGTVLFLQNDHACRGYGRIWFAYRQPVARKG